VTEHQTPRFRALSIDGGGLRGTFAAAFLAEIERMSGCRLVDHFDLICGTSTGGIIALGLGLEIRAAEILDFYLEHGLNVFPPTGRVRAFLRRVGRVKHDPARLREALDSVFGDRRLGEARTRLVIPSFNAQNGSVYIFKTAHDERFRQDYRCRAADVALATSAAPTYLPAHETSDGWRFVDGGIWANNPVAIGVVEAIAVCGRSPDEIDVLSVGTTSAARSVSRKRGRGGLAAWAVPFVEDVLRAQSLGALGMANVMLSEAVLRVDEVVEAGRFSLDDPDDIPELLGLGKNAARVHHEAVRDRFLRAPAHRFEPHHVPGS
jgi:hypothetical protein